MRSLKQRSHGLDWLMLIALMVFAFALNTLTALWDKGAVRVLCLVLAGGCVLFAALYIRLKKQPHWLQLALCCTFVFGLIISLRYDYLYSMHDLGTYYADEDFVYNGHLGVIYRLCHFPGLPLMNPMENVKNSILYHPPLYHWIAAQFMKLNTRLGIAEKVALENLQLVNLFFEQAMLLCIGRLTQEAGVSEKKSACCVLICGLIPVLPLNAAVPNNDLLCAFLCTVCILCAFRWVLTRKMRWIIGTGLSLGFAMAAKMNAALLIPPLAVLFAAEWIRDVKQKHPLRVLPQYAVFLACSVPEGIAWPLYHLLAYGMPLTYVRPPEGLQSMAQLSLWERFGIPGRKALTEIFNSSHIETHSNVWAETFKAACFDEETLFVKPSVGYVLCFVLVLFFFLLLVFSMGRLLKAILQAQLPGSFGARLFFGMIPLTALLYYVRFCYQFPYTCTYNFRYLLFLIPLIGLGIGKAHGKAVKWITLLWVPLVCLCFGLSV